MKLKEVCSITGLTKRTIRFYEEKQLISPQGEWKNGRVYRSYSDEDVKILQEIAVLRRAMFTIEEIYEMQQNPDRITEIIGGYEERIHDISATIQELNRILVSLNPAKIHSVSVLADQISPAVTDLPLPKIDLHPRFKYLDDIEELPPHVEPQENLDDMVPGKRVFVQVNASYLGYKSLNQLNQYYATKDSFQEKGHKATNLPKERLALRIFKSILTGTAILAFIIFLMIAFEAQFYWDIMFRSGAVRAIFSIFLICFVLRLCITGAQLWLQHRHWVQNERKKGK